MKRIINFITVFFVILLMIIWAMQFFGISAYTILSDSMEPILKNGEVVLVNTKYSEVTDGDIIAFYMGDVTVIHRVIEVCEDGIVTKGEANGTPDAGIRSSEDIIGTMICSLGVLSDVFIFLSGKWKMAIIAVLIALNMVVDRNTAEKKGM